MENNENLLDMLSEIAIFLLAFIVYSLYYANWLIFGVSIALLTMLTLLSNEYSNENEEG